jgi:hypothetical protein
MNIYIYNGQRGMKRKGERKRERGRGRERELTYF